MNYDNQNYNPSKYDYVEVPGGIFVGRDRTDYVAMNRMEGDYTVGRYLLDIARKIRKAFPTWKILAYPENLHVSALYPSKNKKVLGKVFLALGRGNGTSYAMQNKRIAADLSRKKFTVITDINAAMKVIATKFRPYTPKEIMDETMVNISNRFASQLSQAHQSVSSVERNFGGLAASMAVRDPELFVRAVTGEGGAPLTLPGAANLMPLLMKLQDARELRVAWDRTEADLSKSCAFVYLDDDNYFVVYKKINTEDTPLLRMRFDDVPIELRTNVGLLKLKQVDPDVDAASPLAFLPDVGVRMGETAFLVVYNS